MTQPKAEDKNVPLVKVDHLPPIVDGNRHHGSNENQSWARGSPIHILGVMLMLIVLWYSVSGRVCDMFGRIRQNPHNSIEEGILNDSPIVKTGKGRPPYREYRQHETTASIRGHFVLYDLLELMSETGDIDITFTPQPRKTRAVLHVGTRSGSIRIRLAPEFLSAASGPMAAHQHDQSPSNAEKSDPVIEFSAAEIQKTLSRPFTNEIHTETGSITATLLTGNGDPTHVGSTAGSLTVDIMAVGVGENDPHSLLDTLNGDGSQTVRVMPLNILRDPVITNLAARHVEHGSGSMDFFYSDEWRGSVKVVCAGSGSLDVEGRDLDFDLREPRRVEAHRGKGELVSIVAQGSGSVRFTN